MTAPRPSWSTCSSTNFAEFAEHVDEGVRQSGPKARQPATPATV